MAQSEVAPDALIEERDEEGLTERAQEGQAEAEREESAVLPYELGIGDPSRRVGYRASRTGQICWRLVFVAVWKFPVVYGLIVHA